MKAHQQRGFSLIEIMVVLLVMGMLVGLVTLSYPDFAPDSELQDYGEDLFAQLRFGSDQALFSGEHVGLVPEAVRGTNGDEHWRLNWHQFRDGQWQQLDDLAPVEPPEFVDLTLEIDEEPVDLWAWIEMEDPIPALVFYGGGEALAATLIMSLNAETASLVNDYERRHVHMDINEMGRIIWRERQAEQELANNRR